MKPIALGALAALLATGSVEAQTYDVLGDYFGGSFTYSAGAFTNISLSGEGQTFDLGGSQSGLTYSFNGFNGVITFDTSAPLGTLGPISMTVESASVNGISYGCVVQSYSQQWTQCSSAAITALPSTTTSAPELSPGLGLSALTLLLGGAAILKSRRSANLGDSRHRKRPRRAVVSIPVIAWRDEPP